MNNAFIGSFNSEILKRIEDFERDFYIVQRHEDTQCECSYESGNGDPKCPLCLGTGKQITIRKIRAAKLDSGLPDAMRPSSEIFMASNYYIKGKYKHFSPDDLVIDLEEREVEYFYQIKQQRSFESRLLYSLAIALRYKIERGIFFENFNKIIGGDK